MVFLLVAALLTMSAFVVVASLSALIALTRTSARRSAPEAAGSPRRGGVGLSAVCILLGVSAAGCAVAAAATPPTDTAESTPLYSRQAQVRPEALDKALKDKGIEGFNPQETFSQDTCLRASLDDPGNVQVVRASKSGCRSAALPSRSSVVVVGEGHSRDYEKVRVIVKVTPQHIDVETRPEAGEKTP